MFDSIRKHQRLLQFILLLLIFPAFAFFGVSGYQKFLGDDDSVASVDGSKIERQEFESARRQQFEQLRRVLGDQADPKILDSAEMVNEVIDTLVSRRALALEASRKLISASDDQLRDAITAIPGLRGADGRFDRARYRTLLSAQGMSEEGFESQMRFDLAVQALPEALSASAIVPRAVLERMIALQEQVRSVRELVIRPSDFAGSVKPTEEQLRKHYEANASSYETAESAKVEYVVLGAQALEAQVKLGADDVRTYYDQNQSRYATPEQRRASHVLIEVDPKAGQDARAAAKARAEEVLKQARGGSDFAALAKASSQDKGSASSGGDLGFFSRENMVKPFADAAFALKEGETSDVVETEFGFHVIRLTGIKPGSARPFEQVRGEIETELRRQQASKLFAEAADTFTNLAYEQADSLQPVAERFGLKVQSAAQVTRSGPPDAAAQSPLANAKVLAALFSAESIKTKRNIEAVDIGGNTLVSARIVEHQPAKRKPFEEVATQVRERVIAQEARVLAVKAGEDRLKALRSAGTAGAGFSEEKPVSRGAVQGLPAAAVDAIFRTSSDKLPAWTGVDLGDRGYAIYELTKTSMPGEDALARRRPQYAQQLAQLEGQQTGIDYLESLKARSKVKRHPERVVAKADAKGR